MGLAASAAMLPFTTAHKLIVVPRAVMIKVGMQIQTLVFALKDLIKMLKVTVSHAISPSSGIRPLCNAKPANQHNYITLSHSNANHALRKLLS